MDGICKIHGCELTGIGSLSFCNLCQAAVDADRAEPAKQAGIGYIVRLEPPPASGEIVLEKDETIFLTMPSPGHSTHIYKISLGGVLYSITSDGKLAYANDTYIGVLAEPA